MKSIAHLTLVVCLLAAWGWAAAPAPAAINSSEELQKEDGEVGQYGGRLVIGQRAEPKTLNPVTATDALSREVIGRCHADLISINRVSQKTEPALAESWKTSPDGRSFTLKLRKGIRFSDGQPFDADDVVFSFTVYLDEAVGSPQRDLLVIDGKPLVVAKLDEYTVRFTLPRPYAAAERLFDGLAMLPKHLLQKPYREGNFAQTWSLNTAPSDVAGLGPFRVKQYVAGQRIVLERNPHYWKVDRENHRLPYLDELDFLFVGGEDQQVMRFEAGETDMVSRLSSENYALLRKEQSRSGWQLSDLGPSLEYNFLLFNLNPIDAGKMNEIARKQAWFRDLKFRQAVSAAVDRDSIVRLVYGARGTALWGNVGPGNKLWMNQSIPHPQRSMEAARQLLKSAGFFWNDSGQLLDSSGKPVEFTIVTSSSNTQRMKMATLIQDDLSHLGIQVHVVPLDFRAMLDRVFQSFDYEAAIMGLGGGDPDPNPEMNVWLSNGATHLWHLNETQPATDWEREIDTLMQQQMVTLDYGKRKKLYDRVQQIIAENVPFVFLATPDVLVGAKSQIGNFHPAVLDHYTLWNADQLYLRAPARGVERAGIR
ncbi:MAG TPA: ABC transporter substrate-binding protein [Terriglobales bacterium]|jgi:peptide/nickel transport system substrate-binding protein|nr:ABC transporter substrate-binding protein [Terriglobales bacterium]